ncbi:DUF748 domain-containing protein [Synoicihabitans lomoniglobus]|uniref:DUF748 domain-containing protein n=1 Tax=Synoicihabitans lomoniglobus TaxID=2909285 RepID=A0AAF0CHK6_9BACT|nr:DUF748 domain-containing protein [Opitutaceae bacterium LMO-M01]WED64427.1 DUF748 domain-containing protein [Opitutaceae bacterium LMO-M01]
MNVLRTVNRRLRSAALLRWLLVVVVLLVVLRAVLPWGLETAVNRRLAQIPGYTGHVEDIDVSLLRGAYQLEGVELNQTDGTVEIPLLRAEEIDFSLAWGLLLRGRVLSEIYVTRAELTFVQGKSDAATQTPTDARWQDVVEDLFPVEIARFEIIESEIRLLNKESDLPYDIRLRDLNMVAMGLRNRAAVAEDLPASLALEANTDGAGRLAVSGEGDLFALQPRFDLDVELRDVDLPRLNDFLRAHAGVDVSAGTISVFAEMQARDGRFEGYVKPFLENVDFSDYPLQDKPILGSLWEAGVSFLATIFKNHERDQLGTRLPFSGELGDANVDTLRTIGGIVRHAFIQAFSEQLDHSIGEDETVSPDTEAAKALADGA